MTEADHALTFQEKKKIDNPFNCNCENVDRSMSMTMFSLG